MYQIKTINLKKNMVHDCLTKNVYIGGILDHSFRKGFLYFYRNSYSHSYSHSSIQTPIGISSKDACMQQSLLDCHLKSHENICFSKL